MKGQQPFSEFGGRPLKAQTAQATIAGTPNNHRTEMRTFDGAPNLARRSEVGIMLSLREIGLTPMTFEPGSSVKSIPKRKRDGDKFLAVSHSKHNHKTR